MADCPPAFNGRKAKILDSLSRPENQYSDLSPKGSVDKAIRELIDRINGIDGLVTTSSCAGRISVFLEGSKRCQGRPNEGVEKAMAEGKGLGGRWLFVSHQPVTVPPAEASLFEIFGLPERRVSQVSAKAGGLRLVKFQFEPMILHVLAASLRHAQIVLSAAVAAGFRESGLQSLKVLESAGALPVVAVRTVGLALSSVVAYLDDARPDEVETLVDGTYLNLLLHEANTRFEANAERIARFEEALLEQSQRQARCGVRKPHKLNGKLRPKEGQAPPSQEPRRSGQLNYDSLCEVADMFKEEE